MGSPQLKTQFQYNHAKEVDSQTFLLQIPEEGGIVAGGV